MGKKKKTIRSFRHCKECKMLSKDAWCPMCKKELPDDSVLTLWE